MLIDQHHKWNHLLKSLNSPSFVFNENIKNSFQISYLVAPVTMAKIIATNAPQILNKKI
ncbi:MAG: hypothetical protein HRU38_06930 [Saccharospirillaceae bacterium]|nr:hypothetical protein [Saccharospirillaceae bacterium]